MAILFQHVTSLTGSFNLWLILAIFVLTLISEFGFSPPYLIESIWLLVGYHVSRGMITPGVIVLFCVISLAGRQIGALTLYKISGFGSSPFKRLYYKMLDAKTNEQKLESYFKKYIITPIVNLITRNFAPCQVKNTFDKSRQDGLAFNTIHLSSFQIALGRFIWLKIPLTITMGLTKQLLVLLAGVALFSLAWDGLYILLGVFGEGNGLKPLTMLLYTFGGFIAVNLLIITIKHFSNPGQLNHSV